MRGTWPLPRVHASPVVTSYHHLFTSMNESHVDVRLERRRTRSGHREAEKGPPVKSGQRKKPKNDRLEGGSVTDDRTRCQWSTMYTGAGSAAYVKYHDEEWGRPVHDDRALFELLILEGAQAGLSWSTILNKRENYRQAFHGFDIAKVAAMSDEECQKLLTSDSGIVRHKGKVFGTVTNARCALDILHDHTSLSSYLWGFLPGGQPIMNRWTDVKQVPAKSPESEAMSRALKQKGMVFVGPTICYAFMQAAGMVNDHEVSCYCNEEITRRGSEPER